MKRDAANGGQAGWRSWSALSRNPWLIVAAVALIASILRFCIARYSLWFDEQASMFFARQPLARLWGNWMVREPNPPLYYTALKYWIMAFGDSQRAVRALSIAAGGASIVTTAAFTRRIYGRRAGVIAALLTALSAQHCYYSLQVRSYELVYLAASVVLTSVVSIDRALREGRGWSQGLLVYAPGCAIAIYLHTTMFLLPVICTVAIIIVRRRGLAQQPTLLLGLMSANVAAALATGWWIDMTIRQMAVGAENIAVFDAITPWLIIEKTIGTLFFAKTSGLGGTVIASIFTVIAGREVKRSWSCPETRLLVAVFCTSIVLIGLVSLAVPIFLPRSIFWLSIVPAALCAAGVGRIARQPGQWLAIAGLGALLAVNAAGASQTFQTEDWDSALRRAQALPGSRLIVQSQAMGLLLQTACERLAQGTCPVPIIAVTTRDDRLDGWSSGLYSGQSIAMENLDSLPRGRYFVFRKEFYHDLVKSLHLRGKAGAIRDDSPLLGPVDRSALTR